MFQNLRVFLSSKMQELAAEREAVRVALASQHIDVFVFEKDAGARPQSIQTTYLEEVDAADVYIGLFWKGYGEYTIEEYERAQSMGMDCLVYEKRENVTEQRDPALQAFLDRVGGVTKDVTIKRFSTAEELGRFVTTDVQGLLTKVFREGRGPRSSPPIYAGVPPFPAEFVGRRDVVTQYVRRLKENEDVAVEGLPGVGKTTLAVAVTRHLGVMRHFSDGVLWASLGPTPDVTEALLRWGKALQTDLQSHNTIAERARCLADVIGGRRLLLVIDDVWHLDAARALRCGGPNCCHLLTTRDKAIARAFAGAARANVLPVLDDATAWELLQALAPEICGAYPEEARNILASVGGLPLAISLIGAYLAAPEHNMFPQLSEEALVELRDPRHRLALAERRLGAQPEPMMLRQTIELSLSVLPPAASSAFRALGAFAPMPARFSLIAGEFVTQAPARTLAALGTRHLVQSEPGGQLTVHQTIADVAQMQVDEAAVARHREHYLHLLRQNWQDTWLLFDSMPQIRRAWESTPDNAMLLAWVEAVEPYFERLQLWHEYINWAERALAAMVRLQMRRDEGRLRANIAVARLYLNEPRESLEWSLLAIGILRGTGDTVSAARALHNVGMSYHAMGDSPEALKVLEQSRAQLREAGDPETLREAFKRLSTVYSEMGRSDHLEATFEADLVPIHNSSAPVERRPGEVLLAHTPTFMRQFRETILLAVFHSYVLDDHDAAGFPGRLVVGIRREADGMWRYWQASFAESERATAQYLDGLPDQADAFVLFPERDEVEVLKRARSGNFEGIRGDAGLFERFLKRYIWKIPDEANDAWRKYGFGLFLASQKDAPALSIPHFDNAVGILSRLLAAGREDVSPKLAESLHGRGLVHEMLNDTSAAAADFDRSIEIRRRLVSAGPSDGFTLAVALEERSVRLARLDRHPDAINDLAEAIEIRRRLADESGDRESAMAALATDLSRRGAALLMTSRLHEALRDLSEVIKIWTPGERNPSDRDATALAQTHEMRADALSALGEHVAAAEGYQSAIDGYTPFARDENSRASLSRCLNALAWLQATSPASDVRDGKKALASATRACELTEWKIPGFMDTLAAALAETGDFDGAIDLLSKVLDVTDDSDKPMFAGRLQLYRNGMPYRDVQPQ